MLAVRKTGKEKGLKVEDVPIPNINDNEVLIAVEAASICGTDLHIWDWDEWSSERLNPPLTIGHEFAGTVVETGKSVTNVSIGDYVSAESHVTCGTCHQCRTNQAHLCPNTDVLGVDRDGAFADYISVPEKVIWQNDRTKLAPEIAALQEPFGNAVFATSEIDLTGKNILVLGCGPVGLFTIGITKASGAARILASDINQYRLTLAKEMGADNVFNPKTNTMDTTQWVSEMTDNLGLDIVFEMTGAQNAVKTALGSAKNGGHVTLFGIPTSPIEIDISNDIIFKNLNIVGKYGRRIFETWYMTRNLLETGAVDLQPLISASMSLEQIEDAINMLKEGNAAKILLRPTAHQSINSGP